jgi:hypothetical protein
MRATGYRRMRICIRVARCVNKNPSVRTRFLVADACREANDWYLLIMLPVTGCKFADIAFKKNAKQPVL